MRPLALLLLWACASTALAAEFSAKVIAVLDGDTVLVLHGTRKVKVRLQNIDAPEKGQDYGMAARQSLADLVLRKQVKVNSVAVDDYGRLVGSIETGGLNVNEEQVRRGMAWEYSRFHSNPRFRALQESARRSGRGLWAQAAPMPPWQWRQTHPAAQPLPAGNCGDKRQCGKMGSCEEARHYFTQCGIQTLDGNGDGVPCESLCEAGTESGPGNPGKPPDTPAPR